MAFTALPTENLVVVRGGGDIATGAVQKLYRAGFYVVVLECEKPTAIRRNVALCQAVYTGFTQVEDLPCQLVKTLQEIANCHKNRLIPILVDPAATAIKSLAPCTVVDAILAKKNCGTHMGMAAVSIALGPGFCAGKDVHAVIETMRGHSLGRLILQGSALPNTGTPGLVGGESLLRVLHAPCQGRVRHAKNIGDTVLRGETMLFIDEQPVFTEISGLLRGLIQEGIYVQKGTKIADVDPRNNTDWNSISDKARCIGGAVLEAHMMLHLKNGGRR